MEVTEGQELEQPVPDDGGGEGQEPSFLEIPDDEEAKIRFGDFEGSVGDFRQQFVPQSSIQEMREKDKRNLERSIEQERAKLATEHQRQLVELQRQMLGTAARPASSQQPQPGLNDQLNKMWQKLRSDQNRQGFVHADEFQPVFTQILSAVQQELATRDRQTAALVQELDKRFSEFGKNSKMLDTLAEHHTSSVWSGFIDKLADEFPDFPRSTIELMASGYSGNGNTPDDIREGIKSAIDGQAKAIKEHKAKVAAEAKRRNNMAKLAGLPGVGGEGVPPKPTSILATSDEITDHFFVEEPPAA